VRAGGEPVLLDLKEAADGGMGPHGLVIGATGSGKSELLRSLVVGLALTHPPEALSFVLVEFKGGAAFADLAGLPHSGGRIANLQGDLAMVDRVHAALQGELERRQRLLRQAGNLDGIKHYQARRALDHGLEPMPYLLLVVDEFGELLASRPDFLDLIVATGRVGRSLGIHLMLASQRLDEGRIRGLDRQGEGIPWEAGNGAQAATGLWEQDITRPPPGLSERGRRGIASVQTRTWRAASGGPDRRQGSARAGRPLEWRIRPST
jgi:ESX secretion system protein EccC